MKVAALLSEVLGRNITHRRLTEDESILIWTSGARLTVELAKTVIKMEADIANGAEVAVFESDNKIVGKKHLREFFETNRELWAI
jgi:festuclavine dehydrogenase